MNYFSNSIFKFSIHNLQEGTTRRTTSFCYQNFKLSGIHSGHWLEQIGSKLRSFLRTTKHLALSLILSYQIFATQNAHVHDRQINTRKSRTRTKPLTVLTFLGCLYSVTTECSLLHTHALRMDLAFRKYQSTVNTLSIFPVRPLNYSPKNIRCWAGIPLQCVQSRGNILDRILSCLFFCLLLTKPNTRWHLFPFYINPNSVLNFSTPTIDPIQSAHNDRCFVSDSKQEYRFRCMV